MDIKVNTFRYEVVHLFPHEQVGLHEQDSWELTYIRQGQGLRVIGEVSTPFKAGEVIIIPPGIPHSWYFDKENTDKQGMVSSISVLFTSDFLKRCAATFPEIEDRVNDFLRIDKAVEYDRKQGQRLISVLLSMQEMTDLQRLSSMIHLVVLMTEPESGSDIAGRKRSIDRKEKFMKEVEIYVSCNAQRDFKLEDIAKHLGMNRTTFCVVFKRTTGKTFITYLNEYRMELACKLLREDHLSISEVCYKSGFNDVPYFNRTFKRMMNVSPTDYRLKNQV